MDAIDGPSTTTKKGRKTRSKKVSDSPSPPSSDTNTSDEEDDEDISRIRLLAARASEQLRKIEKKSVKGKTKEVTSSSGTNKRRVTKMEVETVSEKVVIEHAPPPVFDIKPQAPLVSPQVLAATEPTDTAYITEKQPASPKIESPFASPSHTPSSKASSKQITSKSKERSTKLAKNKSDKSKEDPRAKPVTNQSSEQQIKEKQKKIDEIGSSPVPKTSFKIPKRTHGENGQVC